MSARLRAYGAIPCEVPTIAVEPPRTPPDGAGGQGPGRRPVRLVIFTSVNAVRAVWEKFAEHGLDARHFGGVKIACIGEATADAVRAFGIQPELVPAGEQSPRACWPSSRRTTRSSTRWAGCCCRAPTSPPRPWPPGSPSAAGRSTT
ncbi:uroporphyrinogen-III synthase [Micromonospora siamensis]|uniref:uroporphyrinogen-III synthase n=1 Tax=Micromonospora siamensis TaxID=299152 RepID=UPI0038CC00DD